MTDFPAIFNFDDSNSDTGGKSAAFYRLPSPNGDTFFHKPSGRYSDGLVVLDFLAEKLGLPFLSVYLNSMGTNFRHGANFANGWSTIQPLDARIFEGGFSPIYLDIQLLQFEQFKARTEELYIEGASSYIRNFQAVETLSQHGARAFWIHNMGPIGWLPYTIVYNPPKPGNMDKNGCIMSHNEVAQEFNRQLKDRVVSQLRLRLTDAVFTYVDIYSVKFTLISEAKKHGFTDRLGYCCGHYGEDYRLQCGKKGIVNGSEVFGAKCSNPSNYISWDGIHYSHAANQWVANKIIEGSFSNPPISITQAYHL
ncbi:hypothetical protein LWI29_001818 [Acer saccharum]|uniref:Uncharacterized protein n=1 Tax=Acer saccharum TaxID=4024 RepID=A0AA39UNC5_ACESA|nr:hypothetical protein LWI29_001818 [Acer saccharum]